MGAAQTYRTMLLVFAGAMALVGAAASTGSASESHHGVRQSAFSGVVACEGGGSRPFTAATLRRPRNAERGRSPSSKALRHFLRTSWVAEFYPKHRWFMFEKFSSRGRDYVVFASGRLSDLSTMTFERKRGGKWSWIGSGGGPCIPRRLVAPNLASTRWHLDPRRLPIDPAATSIWVQMMERDCNSGQSADGRASVPIVRYEPNQIVMLGMIKPSNVAATCPSNPPTYVEIKLSEPIGDRALIDGGSVPANTRLSSTQLASLRAGADPTEVLIFQRTDNELCRDAAEGSAYLPGIEPSEELHPRIAQLRSKCPRYADSF